MWPHRRQPTRPCRPWDSPGKNTGVGCHFLLQCMKVKSESEVTQSCPTLSDPMDCSLPGSSNPGIFRGTVLEWGAIAFSHINYTSIKIWLKKGGSPGEGNGNPLQYSCMENSMERGVWWVQPMGSQRVGHDWLSAHSARYMTWRLDVYIHCEMITEIRWINTCHTSQSYLNP